MAAEYILVRVNRHVQGPGGERLSRGQFVSLSDSPYVRALIRGGSVDLVDPPSLEYIDGPAKVEEPKVEEPKVEEPKVEEKKPAKKASDLFKAVESKLEKDVQPSPEPLLEDHSDEVAIAPGPEEGENIPE